jgi:hypothetical protein
MAAAVEARLLKAVHMQAMIEHSHARIERSRALLAATEPFHGPAITEPNIGPEPLPDRLIA